MTYQQILAASGMGGTPAQRLMANGLNLNTLRTNAVLLKDEWIELDTRVVKIAQERLTIVSDLIEMGLTYDLGGIGTTISQWQMESDLTPATISMEPDSEDNRDLLNYELAQVPIPIIHKDFSLGVRQLEATRRMGSNIDLTNADAAARKVAIGMEDLVIGGNNATFGGNVIYGITNHPNRITGNATGPWLGTGNIDNAYQTVVAMLAAADAAHFYGPFNLYVAPGLGMALYQYYGDGSGQTVEMRLQNLTLINKIAVDDRLPAGTVTLIQMDTSVIDLAIGQPLMPVEWQDKGGLVTNYKVLTAMAPRLKADVNGRLGIVHFVGAGT